MAAVERRICKRVEYNSKSLFYTFLVIFLTFFYCELSQANNVEDEHFMAKALELAQGALSEKEFPVGCVIVYQGQVVASGARTGTHAVSKIGNKWDHAEIMAPLPI